jgi:hypothetical protein
MIFGVARVLVPLVKAHVGRGYSSSPGLRQPPRSRL